MLAGSPTVGGVGTPLCDGCKLVLDNENKIWYRNMEIEENLNLCKECFFGKKEKREGGDRGGEREGGREGEGERREEKREGERELFFLIDGTGERPDSHTHEQEFQQFWLGFLL